MQKRSRSLVVWALAFSVVGLVAGTALAEETSLSVPEGLPILRAPILVTTCGQAPGAQMVQLICQLLDVPLACDDIDTITAGELAAKSAEGPAYGVLIVTTGTSLKGMGAAGVNIEYEISRCTALIAKARELGIFIIVAQVEGPSRRSDDNDEKSIKSLSPLADLLITRSDVNGDGYFTSLAEEAQIPQIFIDQTLDLKLLLPLLFPMP